MTSSCTFVILYDNGLKRSRPISGGERSWDLRANSNSKARIKTQKNKMYTHPSWDRCDRDLFSDFLLLVLMVFKSVVQAPNFCWKRASVALFDSSNLLITWK